MNCKGPKVAELNGNVNVVASTAAELTEELVGAHDFVVFTKGTRAEMLRWNAFCRSRTVPAPTKDDSKATKPQPIAFMYCLTGGASGSVFVDHGPGFLVRDKDGKNPLIKLVDRVQEAVDADGVPYTQFRYVYLCRPPRTG